MRVVAATPWTYWMALPILVVTVCTLVVFVGAYLKKVVKPRLLHEDHLRALELAPTGARAAVARGSTLPGRRSPEAVGGTSAARARAREARRSSPMPGGSQPVAPRRPSPLPVGSEAVWQGRLPVTPDRNRPAPKAQRAPGRLTSQTN